MPAPRLNRDDWIAAGFDALQTTGPDALKAEVLARAMGTTKGSFYWHFADVPAFHTALMEAWQTRALIHLSQAVASTDRADIRLRRFGRDILQDPLEPALRHWAQMTPALHAIVQRCDAERLTYVTLLLRELGLSNPAFATAVLATLAGAPLIAPAAETRQQGFDALVDTVLAL